MLIAVDFDGTIVYDHHGPHCEENCTHFQPGGFSKTILPGAIEVLQELHAHGHQLCLWTLRDHKKHYADQHIKLVMEFLRDYGLGFLKLPREFGDWGNYHKFPADHYIDDKAGFTGWHRVAIKFFGLEHAKQILAGYPSQFVDTLKEDE
jgi:hypothetical protein